MLQRLKSFLKMEQGMMLKFSVLADKNMIKDRA